MCAAAPLSGCGRRGDGVEKLDGIHDILQCVDCAVRVGPTTSLAPASMRCGCQVARRKAVAHQPALLLRKRHVRAQRGCVSALCEQASMRN